KESFTRRLALLRGLGEEELEKVAESVRVTDGAEALVRTLKHYRFRTAIISGGFTWFARRLKERLGIDYVYANELEIVDGRLTGKVVGEIIDEDRKAELLCTIAEREGIRLEQVIAVGDGANDLKMLSIAGLGIAFRAKPVVRRQARLALGASSLDSILSLIGMRERDFRHLPETAST